jgi:vitamin B12 transporter
MKSFVSTKRGQAPVRLGASVLAALAAFPVFGQTQSVARLNDVVVTASRVAQAITDVVADVSVIDRTQIELSGARTVTELLALLPGLQATSQGDSGRVFIRGAEARMTALYIDGVRVDSQDGLMLGGGAPWGLVSVAQVDRIEILRGASSAVYGSDAMGGVIQIFTRRGEEGFSPFVNFAVGSFNLQKFEAGFNGAQGRWDYALSVGRDDSDGFNTRPDLTHNPDHEASSRQSGSLRLGHQLSGAHHIELSALSSQLDSQYVPWNGGTDITSKSDLGTAAAKWRANWLTNYRTQLSFSKARIAKSDTAPNDFQTTLQTALFENYVDLGKGTLSAVLEQRKDDFDAKASTWDPAFAGARTQNAVALGYGGTYGEHAVQVNIRHDKDSLFNARQTGALAYAYAFSPNWRANVSTGTAFRAPTLEQVYGPYGDAKLTPETNESHEFGISYAAPEVSFRATLFRNDISNMISSSQTLTTCSAGFFCYYNVGQARLQGLTLSGTRTIGAYQVRTSLDMLDPVNSQTGKTLSLRARKAFTLVIDRRWASWQLGGEVLAVGERFDNAANTIVLPGYALVNLTANVEFGRDWRLVMRADNALNVKYEQVGQYPAPGSTLYVGVQWRPK